VWLLAAFVFLVLGIFGVMTQKAGFPTRSIGFLFWSISSLLSSNLFITGWSIDIDRFPSGLRKILIITVDIIGFILVFFGLILFLLESTAT